MEFIEAILNPNFLPKVLSKEALEVSERSPKNEAKTALIVRENTKLHGDPTRQGCAWDARAHGRASGARLPVRPSTAARVPIYAAGHVSARGARPHARALSCFPLLR